MLVGRYGADVSAKSLADLKGRRVAIVEGYAYGDAVEQSGAAFVRAASEEECLALLLKLTVDFALMDDLVVEFIVRNYPKESATRLQIGSNPLITRELHLALRRTLPDAATIIAGFNAQLRGMVADRTYHRLLHVDWIAADINGDNRPEYVPATDRPGPVRTAACLHVVLDPASARRDAAEDRSVQEPEQQRRVLHRRQHLQRLGERSGELQDHQLASARSEPIDGHHLHLHLVSGGAAPKLRTGSSATRGARAASPV